MNREGQGLSVNVVILVALGLIILIIAVLLVGRSGKNLSDNTITSCISKGGTCKAACSSIDNLIPVTEGNADCQKSSLQTGNGLGVCCRYNFGGETATQ